MKAASFTLRKLLFVGKGLDDAYVSLAPGLNIVYGGSNAGKSFMLRALDFMLGADRLRLPKQGERYETAYLWFDRPDGNKATLERATNGGAFKLYDDYVGPADLQGVTSMVLAPNQKGRTGKTSKNASLSEFLLSQIGIRPSRLVKNEVGQKVQFSIRLLSHYLLVGEDEMIGERSPIQIPEQRMSSLDKSLFRFVLTGVDDSAIIEVPKSEKLAASRDGKIEILTEILATLNEQIAFDDTEDDLSKQLTNISNTVDTIQEEVVRHQSRLDALLAKRRDDLDAKRQDEFKAAELRAMAARFEELKSVYESDINRLAALEEAGFLLQRLANRSCPLCGADAVHQHQRQGSEEVELQRRAATAEIAKIRCDLTDLTLTMASLDAELIDMDIRLPSAEQTIGKLDLEIKDLRPLERDVRARYEFAISVKADAANRLKLAEQKSEYETKIADLKSLKIGRQRVEGLSIEVSKSTAHEFSKTVKEVLEAWQFPDMGNVYFDSKTQDIVVNGRERADNGKGIRAILHSAFKVALLIYCREKNLPHPGFVVLDSPLLTYRGPLQFEKHGDLAEDEVRLKQTPLNLHFYDHLASLAPVGQIIVLENQDPPQVVRDKANVIMFSGEKGSGRQGFFPPFIAK